MSTKIHIDNGYCRITWKQTGQPLICVQACGCGGWINFEVLECTRSGEPSHPIQADLSQLPVPAGNSSIEQEYRAWLANEGHPFKKELLRGGRLIIAVDGGLIQSMHLDGMPYCLGLGIEIRDFDTEGAEEDSLTPETDELEEHIKTVFELKGGESW